MKRTSSPALVRDWTAREVVRHAPRSFCVSTFVKDFDRWGRVNVNTIRFRSSNWSELDRDPDRRSNGKNKHCRGEESPREFWKSFLVRLSWNSECSSPSAKIENRESPIYWWSPSRRPENVSISNFVFSFDEILFSFDLIQIKIFFGRRQTVLTFLFDVETFEQFVENVIISFVGRMFDDSTFFQEKIGQFSADDRFTEEKQNKKSFRFFSLFFVSFRTLNNKSRCIFRNVMNCRFEPFLRFRTIREAATLREFVQWLICFFRD